jgi:hypothetical protein
MLFTICLWTQSTQQNNTIVTPKLSHNTLHSPLLMRSFNVCPQWCVHLVLISFQQNGVNFTFREVINTRFISLHIFFNNLFPTCPNHNIMKILWCFIIKKLPSHKNFNCIHLSLHLFIHYDCRNLSLRLVTKAKACKGASQEWSPRISFHAPERLRIWENGGIEPPHSQVNSHFGSWSHDGLPNLQRTIVGVKTHWIKKFLISLVALGI